MRHLRLKQSFSFSWWTVTSLHSKNVLQFNIVLKIVRTRNQPPYCLLQLQEKKRHSASLGLASHDPPTQSFLGESYFTPLHRGSEIRLSQKRLRGRLPPVGLSWDSPHPPPESVRTDGQTDGWTYADVRTKIFRINGLPNLLTHGAPRAPLKSYLPQSWMNNKSILKNQNYLWGVTQLTTILQIH